MVRRSDLISDALSLRAQRPGDIIFIGCRPPGRGEINPDGRELKRADYPRLNARYAAMGYPFGAGNGTTTFNIPDVRGRALVGRDTMGKRGNARRLRNQGGGAPGFDSTLAGAAGGLDRGTIEVANMPGLFLSTSSTIGPALTGKTTGTGGDQLYQTTALTDPTPMSRVQPSMVFDFALCLGQDEIVIPPIPEPNVGTDDLEFNGPFNDWIDLVAEYDADTTGATPIDDIIEQALEDYFEQNITFGSIADPNTHYLPQALYLPGSGDPENPFIYSITRPILLPDKATRPGGAEGFMIVGEDPRTAIIRWNGVEGGNMMWMAGWHSGQVSRIGFDGNGTAGSGIRIERDFDISLNQTNNRISYCIFRDMERGIENTREIPGASTDSEIGIFGCRFYNCTEYGVLPTAPEAYDYWVRNCYFEGCGIGIGRLTDPGYEDFTLSREDPDAFDEENSGSFSAYDNVFNGSLQYDMYMANGQNVDIIGNASFNSSRFLRVISGNMTIALNRIVNPINTDCVRIMSQWGALANAMFALNEFHMPAGTTGAIVVMEFNAASDEYRTVDFPSRGNDPRYKNPTFYVFRNKSNLSYGGQITYDPFFDPGYWKIQDMLTNQTVSTDPALIFPIPPKVERQTFYFTNTPVNGQATIDAAEAFEALNPDSRPVIYFPFFADGARRTCGTNTLEFPAGVRMSLQSGHYGNSLGWGVSFDEENNDIPMVLLRGPSRIEFRNFRVKSTQEGGKYGLHVVVDNCNQVGARVYMQGCVNISKFKGTNNLSAWLVNHQVNHFGDDSMPFEVFGSVSEATTGGVVLEGATGGTSPDVEIGAFHVKGGGHLWMRGYWYETGTARQRTFTLEENDQKGFVSIQSSRFRNGDSRFPPGVDKVHWNDIQQLAVDEWNGDLIINCVDMANRPLLSGDLSDFRYVSLSSLSYPFDDGGHFVTYDGAPIAIKGTIDDTNAQELPSEGNTHRDGWYVLSTGHLWVYDSDHFVDIGGIVGTVQSVGDLAPSYDGVLGGTPGGVLDAKIVSDTSEVHQWNGSSWDNLANSSITPMPSEFYHFEGTGEGHDQSNNWNLYKWVSTPPPQAGGSLPTDHVALIEKMLTRRPPKFITSLAEGVTDMRFYDFGGFIQFEPGTFEFPPES